jgi:4-aminobutyrate aminotransferase-like enzyme/Ser/Thr protein kinase RdoA (MazF antagonist)
MIPEARVAPPVSAQEAVRIAREVYGLDVTASSLPGEYDDNFHLIASGGHAFVLKIMHCAREESLVEMQCKALQHLEQRAARLALPRVQATKRGEPFTKVELGDGERRIAWLLTFLPGSTLAEARPHAPEMLRSLGQLLGEMDKALQDFSHPAARRRLKWDLSHAGWIREYLGCVTDPTRHALAEQFLELYESQVVPVLPQLRRSVIYGDANDYNALVSPAWPQPRRVVSLVDFGDMHWGLTAAEVAVAAAYASLGERHPVRAAATVIAGYHRTFPLEELEISLLFPLIMARLSVSVVNSAHRKTLVADDPYVTVSEARAWEALGRLAKIHPRFAHYSFRAACGLRALPQSGGGTSWFCANAKTFSSIVDADLRTAPSVVFDLSVGSTLLGANPGNAEVSAATRAIDEEMKRAGAAVGIGRYDEPRALYSAPQFASSENPTDERRTLHLAIDLFVEPGAVVRAPLDGVVHKFANNSAPLDYGPVVILKHAAGDGQEFFTLYGHLSTDSLSSLQVGKRVARGETFARVGDAHENGGWPPHIHFQVILDLLDRGTDFPGVAFASEREVWTSLSPDPNLLLGIPADRFPGQEPVRSATLAKRRALLGKNLSIAYREPLKIVRGWMQYLYDDTGRAYLDVYNNVPLVGHSHPRVVEAAQAQLALLNTNTRYLHDSANDYAERLTQSLPEPLRVCYFLNSGSEANELALRMARTHTRREDVIVLQHAYHGNTTALIDLSPYKFDGPGGSGRKPWVHVAPIADDYRGIYRRGETQLGEKYASHVAEIVERVQADGRGVAAFLAETLPSVAGQIVFPDEYLAAVYQHVRAGGGVCIADEVQVGFGRLGAHFWGFESQAVVPDIVVLGKPIGNGFPLAAVVTTPQIAESFDNGMEFFSTFGGNPVACAAGLAVLDVLQEENLQANAVRVGDYFAAKLRALQSRHVLIGDVRGSGLFLGIDLVRDRETREAATEETSYVVNRLRECGILAGSDGPYHNVLKLRPPLMFSESDADLFVSTLDQIVQEDAAQPRA